LEKKPIPRMHNTGKGNIAFWTEAPPLPSEAAGNHGVARHFCKTLAPHFKCVVTHRFRRSIRVDAITDAAAGLPIMFYPDCCRLGLRRISQTLGWCVDLVLFTVFLPFLLGKLRQAKVQRVFVLAGADAWFLIQVRIFQCFSSLPVDLYLVDEIEHWVKRQDSHPLKPVVRQLLDSTLKASDRLFAISRGFAEYIHEQYGLHADWLPLPSSDPPAPYVPLLSELEDARYLTFLGGFSFLYQSTLLQIYETLSTLNQSLENGKKPWKLQILTFSNGHDFRQSLADPRWLEIRQGLSDDACEEILRHSTACLLPYSFEPTEKMMVCTSFSCKILEYLKSGRPIITYGPAGASLPRFFKDHGWPLSATTESELLGILESLPEHDTEATIERYRKTWDERHSPRALESVLGYIS
jgi:hypothetical protein